MNPTQIDEAIQAPIPDDPLPPEKEETEFKIRPLERMKLPPKDPIEQSTYGKYKNFSRYWMVQDGRECDLKGSEHKDSYKIVQRRKISSEGKRRQLMTDFFWDQMLNGLVDELTNTPIQEEHGSEYESAFIKDNFQPRDLAYSSDPTLHVRYPLYGSGSSAITYYSETVRKTDGDITEPFRKTQDFTKPIGERLDDGWVL